MLNFEYVEYRLLVLASLKKKHFNFIPPCSGQNVSYVRHISFVWPRNNNNYMFVRYSQQPGKSYFVTIMGCGLRLSVYNGMCTHKRICMSFSKAPVTGMREDACVSTAIVVNDMIMKLFIIFFIFDSYFLTYYFSRQ